ncbi:MAG: helix-hairpin-helix domain-containing protein, partial [bacterium]
DLKEALGDSLSDQEIKKIIDARGDREDAYKNVGDLLASIEEIRGSTSEASSQGQEGRPQSGGPQGRQGESGQPQQLSPDRGGQPAPGVPGSSRGKVLFQRVSPQPSGNQGQDSGRSGDGQRAGGRGRGSSRQPEQVRQRGRGQSAPVGRVGSESEGQGDQREATGPILSAEKFRQIADKVTVKSENKIQGRININTASETVLNAVLQDRREVAEAIFAYRKSEEFPFDDIGEILAVSGVTTEIFRAICDRLCVRSGTFSGRFIGYLPDSGAYKELRVVLDRTESAPRVVYWKVVR